MTLSLRSLRTRVRRYQPPFADKSKIADAIGAIGRPVLILVDEILDYVRQLSLANHPDLANRTSRSCGH